MNEITIICPGVEHRYQSAKGAVLLISPETHLSKELIARYIPHEESGYACIDRTGSWSEPETPIKLLEGFLTHLAPTGCLKFHVDERFSRLLKEVLQRILEGDILDADLQWACTRVHLSESRFMHRFKELVGIPWRSYLLWARLLAGILHTRSGLSLTEASIAVGFSDSAHFSRTFKANFGIAPSRVTKVSRFIQAPWGGGE